MGGWCGGSEVCFAVLANSASELPNPNHARIRSKLANVPMNPKFAWKALQN
jgi:hypothetical protein